MLAAQGAAWRAHDMAAAWAQALQPDADFVVVVTGRRLVGRNEIQRYHAELLSQLYKDFRPTNNPRDVSFLTPNVALVRSVSVATYNNGKESRQSTRLAVLVKREGRWRIASVQNTLSGGAPATPVQARPAP